MRRIAPALVCALFLGGCSEDAPRTSVTPSPSPAATTPAPTPSATQADPYALARSLRAEGPEQLAQRLTDAERAIRSSNGEPGSDAPRVQQAAYRQLVDTPAWRDSVRELLPADLRASADANVEAGAELRALTKPRPALPADWRIVAPPAPEELRAHYAYAERETQIPWYYLAAVHLVETRMGRIRGDSEAGARGPMQFLPSTWEAYGEGDILDPRDAIRAAGRYLAAHGGPARMDRALYAYNRSERYVRAVDLYARQMEQDERAYYGYYGWEVYYRTTGGDALLPVGWSGSGPA